MGQFVFTSKFKNIFIAMMAVGVLCMGITWFTDDQLHTRFWTNYLHNSMFFTGIAFGALFLIACCILTYAQWNVAFKRLWEAYSMFLGVGLILMLVVVVGVLTDFHHLYHWADAEDVAKDRIMRGKSSFLNPTWYTLGTIIVLGAWYYFARKLRSLSIEMDKNGSGDYSLYRKTKVFSAIFLPIAGFSSAAMIWQWLMSLDAHWYSTMFAWYTTASWVVATFSLTIIILLILKNAGHFSFVTIEHLHDLAKMVFAFSIFWTYLWFSQFMLIWYGNNGEETTYFKTRMDEYPLMFYGIIVINFVLPFLLFIGNGPKRRYGTLMFVSCMVFFGHWLDFFQIIKPGTLHTAHEALAKMGHGADHAVDHGSHFVTGFTIPGLLELGTFVGFLGLFLYFAFNQLTKASTKPVNDPFWQETVHHHVQQ